MTIDEQITLLNDAENALLKRTVTTTDTAEKQVLETAIGMVREMRDQVAPIGARDMAVRLNQLAGVIENATAALKTRPFDAVLGAYQSLFERIGVTIGQPDRPEWVFATESPADGGTAAFTEPRAVAGSKGGKDAEGASLSDMFASCRIHEERLGEIDRYYIRPLIAGRPPISRSATISAFHGG